SPAAGRRALAAAERRKPRYRMTTTLITEAQAAFSALAAANRAFSAKYPGPSPERQPVHTVYGGAQLFSADTARRLGQRALGAMQRYGRDPVEFALGVGFVKDPRAFGAGPDALASEFREDPLSLRAKNPEGWLACAVYERVVSKLEREPVEDFRIDFEDGFGARPDAEEDAAAQQAARETARGLAAGTLP